MLRHAAVAYSLAFGLSLFLRLLPGTPPALDLADAEISIRSSGGKYVEVGENMWLYASHFSHNKPSCRFEVQRADESLVRSLTSTREYHETAGDRVGWDVRGASDGHPMDDLEETPAADNVDGLHDEGELIGQPSRRLLFSIPAGSAAGPEDASWVLLRSAYAGGFVEVVPRGQDDEYVVRVAKDGMLSFRSLLKLSRFGVRQRQHARAASRPACVGAHRCRGGAVRDLDGSDPGSRRRAQVWSYATKGYLNFRDGTDNDPRQHVRAHGNEAPFLPVRELLASARMHVERRPPVRDVLGSLRCPSIVPPWDWKLLLDAARAGACGAPVDAAGGADIALRRAAHALRLLGAVMGADFAYELEDLANAYRSILTEPVRASCRAQGRGSPHCARPPHRTAASRLPPAPHAPLLPPRRGGKRRWTCS